MDTAKIAGRFRLDADRAAGTTRADLVRAHLAALGINEQDIRDAVAWTRRTITAEVSPER